ncbi:TetR/AcrR family transcriptional regulator [Streptomyces sp. NPDC096311]|uniref:TetR/AcrR family transcriptional regulator n=1 Tax=Streptomyces sp. NPDC096311 TaxID=3366083 RepID=UPI003823A1C4
MPDRPAEEPPTGRRVRPDVQRSLHALLTAAAEVFATDGVDAPVRRITTKAGVGAGTLYRHFPQRSDLITAVFRREIDACADAAPALAEEYQPVEALERWLRRFAQFLVTKRGLKAALHSSEPATYESLPVYFQDRLVPAITNLVDAAAKSGGIRSDVVPYDLLRAMSDLVAPDDPDYTERVITLLADGLRYGADGADGAGADFNER